LTVRSPQDTGSGTAWRPEAGVGRAEEGEGWSAYGCGDVARSGVVADEQVGPGEKTRQIQQSGGMQRMQRIGKSPQPIFFDRSPEEENLDATLLQFLGQFEKAFQGPALVAAPAARVKNDVGGV